jgi:hypothetical protein
VRFHQGFAVVTTLLLCVVLGVLITAYFFTTNIELSSNRATTQGVSGFYAAEGGLNLRGETIRQTFVGYNVPTGTSPSTTSPCQGTNVGTGSFACQTTSLNGMNVSTYVIEDASNASGGKSITIPSTEAFGGLNAVERRYSVFSSAALPNSTQPSALLEMVFRSRVVPLFQFAAFYNKDLEILPGADMNLNGRVHVNGNLFLNSDATLSIGGQVTVAKDGPRSTSTGRLYRGRKNTTDCKGTVRIDDLNASTNPNPAIACPSGGRGDIAQSTLNAWNGQIQTGLDYLRVPSSDAFDPNEEYWKKADLRVVLDLAKDPVEIYIPQSVTVTTTGTGTNQVKTYNYVKDVVKTSSLSGCNAVSNSKAFYNNREGKDIDMLEVNVQALLNCLHKERSTLLGSGKGIDETSEGGLVWHFTVNGANSSKINNYGVRLTNGSTLASNVNGAPAIKGLTVATDQAVYIQGDYNTGSNWRPASILADSLNILSNAWADVNAKKAVGERVPTSTTINAAFLAGTDTTGVEGSLGGSYGGGLENYPRFHEDWSKTCADGNRCTLTYRGSLVSLYEPNHVNGNWGTGNVYNPPRRDWNYESRFNNPENLPPLSPRFVYLRQELFVRDFEQ